MIGAKSPKVQIMEDEEEPERTNTPRKKRNNSSPLKLKKTRAEKAEDKLVEKIEGSLFKRALKDKRARDSMRETQKLVCEQLSSGIPLFPPHAKISERNAPQA